MKLTDVNLLLYAVDTAAPLHALARRWLETELSGGETFAFSWPVILAFLRLSTSPRVFDSPLQPAEAFDLVDSWLALPNTTVVNPTDRHSALLRQLLVPLGAAGNLVTDAHLAALSIEHGAELCSSDADFSRFSGVRWRNPLS
ncbi:MAG TPA: type II toxin-antitoxin system VapC family toxin [Candidatus Limnocylindria bacterium]|nr:type II toxin-antitoxin system VapC family toxin [Candidatus Limnocylindria bacterium]